MSGSIAAPRASREEAAQRTSTSMKARDGFMVFTASSDSPPDQAEDDHVEQDRDQALEDRHGCPVGEPGADRDRQQAPRYHPCQRRQVDESDGPRRQVVYAQSAQGIADRADRRQRSRDRAGSPRSEEHTSELQSLRHLVCRLLLEKKKRDETDRMEDA